MTNHVDWMCHDLTQRIRKIKTFKLLIKTLSSQKTQGSSVGCWDHCDRIETVKSIVLSLNYPCFAKIFNFFVKIEIPKKINCWVTFCFALGVTKHHAGVKIRNKFYYVQTAKVLNLKHGSC